MKIDWREIEEARERLYQYKLKIQPYPAYPEEPSEPTPEPEWTAKQWDKVQQLQSEVQGWRLKHSEMMLALDIIEKGLAKKDAIPDPF